MENSYGVENGMESSSLDTSVEVEGYPNYMESDHGLFNSAFLGAGFFITFFTFFVILYVYYAFAFQKMAKKVSIPDDWFAWVPVLHFVLLLRIANRPLWWIILMFIPIVNIIVQIMIWMDVAKAMRKPEWVGALAIVPVVNLIIPGYLAFSDKDVIFEGPGGLNQVNNSGGSGDFVKVDSQNADLVRPIKMENPANRQFVKKEDEGLE